MEQDGNSHSYKIERSLTALVLILPLVRPVIALGTSIVAIRTPSEMYVAADSKVTVFYTDGRIIEEKTCKIHQTDGLFFANAGFIKDETGLFDAPLIVAQARRAGGTFLDTVTVFEKLVEPPLSRFWDWYKDHHPIQYEKHRQHPVRIAFFGVENQTPVFYLRDLQVQISGSGSHQVRVERRNCPPECSKDGRQLIIISAASDSFLSKFMDANPDYWKTHDPVQTVVRLIELDILAAPDKSGGPIDVLHLDRQGARWVQKKSECVEIRSY